MRATPPARLLAWVADFVSRFWGLLVVIVIVALEGLVFAPRGMLEAMLGSGIIGAAVAVAWLLGGSPSQTATKSP